MKKKLLFLIPMIIVAVLLFMLRATGMTAHIAVSVVGLVLLIAYTVATKKEWKNSALEILQRVCYAVALISGIALKGGCTFAAMPMAHKISAVLFVVLFAAAEIHKVIKK
jgi:hypothetical protein